MLDPLTHAIADIGWFAQQELGHTGLRRCTEMRAAAGRTRVLVTFEVSGRPIRLGLRKVLVNRYDEFTIYDYQDILDDHARMVWSVIEDTEPRYANSPDERYHNLYWACPTCGGDEINAVSASNGCRECG